jgi:hypothetical protein
VKVVPPSKEAEAALITAPPTIIFDRSAFHGRRFDLLAASPLIDLTKQNRIVVHHSAALLEETISMFEKEENHAELRKQLPFILDICNGRWFRGRGEIWELELTRNLGPTADVFEPDSLRRVAEQNIRDGVFGDKSWEDFKNALPEKEIERQKQTRLHKIQSEMRREIAARRKADRRLKRQKPPPAVIFIEKELEHWGQEIISRYVGTSYRALLVRRWAADKHRYPFLTSSLEGQVFADWQALVEHNKRIDRNAHVDVEVLACLNRADAIVSADAGFLKDAFDVLWRPKGKLLYTPEAFVHYMDSLRT